MSMTMPFCLLFAFLINKVFSTDCVNDVVITEIKPGRSDKTDIGTYGSNANVADDKWRGRFLEFWNKGKDLGLNQLRLTGFVNTGIQPTFPVTLPIGSYMVFYEETGNNEDDISCYRCTSCTITKDCTEPTSYTWNNGANNWAAYPNDANCQSVTSDDIHQPNSNRAIKWVVADPDNRGGGRCWGAINPAIYIPCPLCSTTPNPTWGSYDCCINDTMDEYDWTQRIFDTQSGVEILIDEVIYNSDVDWPVVSPGYPYHLIQKTYPNEAGSNWIESCYPWGTPGDDPLDFCPPRCDTASCRSAGDTSATCSVGNGICVCSAPEYYANGRSCRRIPVIGVCEALWLKIDESQYVMQFKWDGVLFGDKEYLLTYEDKQFGTHATVSTTQTAFDLSDVDIAWNGNNVSPGVVAVRVIDESGKAVVGRETMCTIITSPPTSQARNEFGKTVHNIELILNGYQGLNLQVGFICALSFILLIIIAFVCVTIKCLCKKLRKKNIKYDAIELDTCHTSTTLFKKDDI